MSRGNVAGEWCRECQDEPVAGCPCENCRELLEDDADAAAELEAQLTEEEARSTEEDARLFYRQFPLHNPNASWNFILDLAELEFGMTFADDMTPRTQLMHDTLSECYGAALNVAAAGALTRSLSLSLSLSL
jgi:hypothetical protein